MLLLPKFPLFGGKTVNHDYASSAGTSSDNVPVEHRTTAHDIFIRLWVTRIGLIGTALLASFFFGFLICQTIWGGPKSPNWLTAIAETHFAALLGTPMSAVTAFCIVSLLKVTNGPIEFEAFTFKFRGASGPIVFWILCFGSIVLAFHKLWSNI